MVDTCKVIQIGVGSMGKRRIRNLNHLGFQNIDCFDIKSERVQFAAEKYSVRPIFDDNKIKWSEYSHIIISTPPDVHMHYAKIGVENGLNTFVEASVTIDNMREVISLYNHRKKNFLLSPSCTMRFDPIVKKTKEIIDSNILGKTLSINHYFGQYLPNWHPYESINDFYVSKKETGAAREIVPFDLVYLIWLFGDITQYNGYTKNTGHLGIGIDDIYCFNAVTADNAMLQMTIEVLSRVPIRETKVILENGYILLDIVKGVVSVFESNTQSWKYFKRNELSETFSSEEMYVKELSCFMEASLGKGNFPYTMEQDLKILETLEHIENKSIRL